MNKTIKALAFSLCLLLTGCGGEASSVSEPSSSSESSDSSVTNTKHSILVDLDETVASYTISESADGTGKYEQGEEVELYVTITDPHYEVVSVFSENVSFTNEEYSGSAATVSFTMPSTNVLIEVTTDDSAAYVIKTLKNYYPSTISDISISEGDGFVSGSIVTFTFLSSEEYEPGYYYFNVNGVGYTASSYTAGSEGYLYKCYFEMPAENVILYITYARNTESSSGCKITVEDDDYITWIAPITGQTLNYVSVYGVFYKKPGVSVDSVEYQLEGSDTWKSCSSFRSYGGSTDCVYTYVYYLQGNATFRVNYTLTDYYKLSFVNDETVSFYSVSYYEEYVTAGDKVHLYYTAIDGMYISAKASYEGIREEDISFNTWLANAIAVDFTFNMPSNDATVIFNTGDKINLSATEDSRLSIQISFARSLSNLYEGTTMTQGAPGSTIYIAARPRDSYIITGYYVNDTLYAASFNESYYSYYISFTCPSTDVNVYAVFDDGYVATTDVDSEKGYVAFGNIVANRTYYAGTAVTFTIVANEGYVLNTSSVTVKDVNGNLIEYTEVEREDGYYSGTFTMPESNIVVSADFYTEVDVELDLSGASDTSLLTSVTVRGSDSSSILSLNNTSATFYVGEKLSVSITYSSQYSIHVYEVTSAGTETEIDNLLSSIPGSFYNSSAYIGASAAKIRIVLESLE